MDAEIGKTLTLEMERRVLELHRYCRLVFVSLPVYCVVLVDESEFLA